MIEVRRRSSNQLALGFAAGAALTALVTLVGSALAQSPTPVPALTPLARPAIGGRRAPGGTVGADVPGPQ